MDIREFIDSSNPLMERFKETAPGTYKHCQNVATFCESVSKELGLDTDTLVVAATLHDIGKCFLPTHYIENTVDGENPHDKLDPKESYQIISRHVPEGVLKLLQLGLPQEVLKTVSEHHGDTLVRNIYEKAKAKYNGETVEDFYRYHSCKPSTPESCVLMICDVVESACRAMNNAGKLKEPKETIDTLVNSLIDDEQLDLLKLGDLRIIRKTLYAEIKDTYHKRIEYDKEE